jgi:predicted transcriptional regulator
LNAQSSVKVSINIPHELKKRAELLKDETKVPLNTIYKQAIAEYLEKQELKKWEKSVDLALQNKEYLKSCEEMGNLGTEFCSFKNPSNNFKNPQSKI